MIEKFFNTAGPQKAELNYTIDPLSRLDWAELRFLIDSQRYFLLHAPRQTGKTTAMAAIAEALNNEGRYTALYVNIEIAQTARNDVTTGNRAIANAIAHAFRLTHDES